MSPSPSAATLQRSRVIAGALLLATLSYAVAGTYLVLSGFIPSGGFAELSAQTALIVKVVLLLAGFASTGASFVLRRTMDGRVPPGEEDLPSRVRNMIVAMALGESAGVMGFAVALLTADATFALLLWGAALAGCILHFPTQAAFGIST